MTTEWHSGMESPLAAETLCSLTVTVEGSNEEALLLGGLFGGQIFTLESAELADPVVPFALEEVALSGLAAVLVDGVTSDFHERQGGSIA